MTFPCVQCGLCCRLTATMPDETLAGFGLTRGASGYCAAFDVETGRCQSYDTRPDICRIPQDPERYRMSAQACNVLLETAGRVERITEAMVVEALR